MPKVIYNRNMKNEIIKVKCIDMTVEGYGVAKVNQLVIFVKGMIVDEVASIKIIAAKKNLAYAIIDELLVSSPYRVTSVCPIAHKCGGCDLRHIAYPFQLQLKKQWVKETLRNVGGLDLEVKDVEPSPLIDKYRNKVQVPVKDGKLGFYRRNSHEIMEYEHCYIESDISNEIVNFIKDIIFKEGYDQYFRHILIKHAFATGEIMVGLILNVKDFAGLDYLVAQLTEHFEQIKSIIVNVNCRNDNVILGEEEHVVYGSSYIVDKLDGLSFKISLKSFYQVNPLQTVNLYNEVVKRAGIDKNAEVLDLYSGIGSISLFVSRFAKHVTGVEIVAPAVENAKDNAMINHIDNVDFYLDDAANHLKEHLINKDVVIVDPPRKGLNKSVIEDIAAANIKKIVYVSCNKATLARDLKLFKEHGYQIDYVKPFDMFPQTVHVECVANIFKA